MFSTLLAFTLVSQAALPQVSCTAVFRTLDGKNNTVERSLPLRVKGIAQQIQLQGKTFEVLEDRGDLAARIYTPGDLAKGVSFRGAPDRDGHFSATQVYGFTVYRLECSRN